MRTIFSIVTTLLLVSGAASSQLPEDSLSERGGEVLTISVEGTPADIEAVVCDLAPDLRGVELRRSEDGAWTATLAVLPQLVSSTLRPTVRLYDDQNNEQPVNGETGMSVSMASSDFDEGGLAEVLD